MKLALIGVGIAVIVGIAAVASLSVTDSEPPETSRVIEPEPEAQSTESSDFDDQIPVYVAIVSAFGVIGAIIFNVHNLRRDLIQRNTTLITEFSRELGEMFQEETKLKTKEECENYIMRYLDALRRVNFLYEHGKIPKKMTGFFDEYFSYGRELIGCYTKVESENEFVKGIKKKIDKWLGTEKKVSHKKLAKAITDSFASIESLKDDNNMK